MSDDEGDEQLLGEMLESMRDMVRVYTSRLQDRVDELEAEIDAQHDRISALKWRGEKDRLLLKNLRALVAKGEMNRVVDTVMMARIRGLLHE